MSAVLKTVEVPDELDWRDYGKNEWLQNSLGQKQITSR